MTPAMKQCDRCIGTGLIPRTQRRLPAVVEYAVGELDPLDIIGQHKETCDKCGGSGAVVDRAVVAEVRRGYAADLMTSLSSPFFQV